MSSKTKSESNLTELALAVLLLALLALLTANILVFLIAARHNDEICRAVTIAAAKAAVEGEDKKNVYMAAWQELGLGGYGGFFIDAPKIAQYSDDTKNNERQIKVQTTCIARVPVINLIIADDIKKILTLKRTCVIKIGLAPDAEKSDKSLDDEDSNTSTDPKDSKDASNSNSSNDKSN